MSQDTAVAADDLQREWEAEEAARGAVLAGQAHGIRLALVAVPVVLLAAGAGLRRVVPHPEALVIAVVVVLVLLAAVLPEAGLHAVRLRPDPPWVAEFTRYRRWVPQRSRPVPAQVMAAADYYLARLTGRLASGHWMIIRRGDLAWVPMGTWQVREGRLVFYLSDEAVCDAPDAALVTLAHETRHQTGWRPVVHNVSMTGRLRGYAVIGWAAPWPDAVWAALAWWLLLMLTSWVIEVSCDLGAAADAGEHAIRVTFEVISASHRRPAAGPVTFRRWLTRAARWMVKWLSGPAHPPTWLRKAIAVSWCRLRRREPRRPWLRHAMITSITSAGPPPPRQLAADCREKSQDASD